MSILTILTEYAPILISGIASLVFLDSLRYKFTDHPKTQEIFGRLDSWAGALGAPGLFAKKGLFSQYVIGTAELAASVFLLVGNFPSLAWLQGIGALIAVGVMTGAISFHLFTPLGIDPNKDGGGLFKTAVSVWILSIVLLVLRWQDLLGLLPSLR